MSKLLGIRYTGDKVSGVRIEILGSRKQIVLSTECREYHFIGADTTNEVALKYYGGLQNAGIAMILDDNKKDEVVTLPTDETLDTTVEPTTSDETPDESLATTDGDADEATDDSTDAEPEDSIYEVASDEVTTEDVTDEDDVEPSIVEATELSDDEVTEYLDTQVEDIDALCDELGIKLKSRKRESQIAELVKSYKNEVVVKMIESTKE